MSPPTRKPIERLAAQVLTHHGKDLQRYFMRGLNHTQNARDLEQEVYLRLLRVDDAELIHNPKGYVYRIAAHVIFEFRERARRELVTFDSQAVHDWAQDPAHAAPDLMSERMSTERELERLLETLQPLTRAVFLLQKRDGLSREEVARKLGISPHTVKKHMLRALATLRRAAGELEGPWKA